jgi:hypothetical protein
MGRGLRRRSGRIDLSPWLAMDYYTIWRTQPSVRRTVSFLARNIAQLSIHLLSARATRIGSG